MGCKGYYGHTFFDETPYFAHRAEYGTANSTSNKKGKDNKKDNTPEYNHKYYTEHPEKWKDNESSSKKKTANKSDDDDLFYDKDGKARFGHKDFDPNDPDFKRTDGEKIEGTGLRTFTNSNGSTIIIGDGIKFSFPPGTKITKDMAKRIASIEGGDKSDKERYVAKMLNAVTGFADKQKLDLGEKKKSSKKGSTKKEENTSQPEQQASKSTKKNESKWEPTINKYMGGDAPKKSAEDVVNDYQEKGKSTTEYYKKQKKK